MRGYISDENGQVVWKFDGPDPDVKNGHDKNLVDDLNDLPEIDQQDWDYLNR